MCYWLQVPWQHTWLAGNTLYGGPSTLVLILVLPEMTEGGAKGHRVPGSRPGYTGIFQRLSVEMSLQ